MKRIAITGADGVIGTLLMNSLTEYTLVPITLPQNDVRDYSTILNIISGSSVVIHLAWDDTADNFRSHTINSDNTKMFSNIYRAAVATKVKRVIMASSIHANDDTPYGYHKRFMEQLGKYYALEHDLDVICIRFGGVNAQDTPHIKERNYKKIWLRHSDCVSLVKHCIDSKIIPKHFQILEGISRQ
jgi:nucleoside-diphosphate-sugar epimerase